MNNIILVLKSVLETKALTM